jgi:ABC-type molybdate transport system substrate-binding protein
LKIDFPEGKIPNRPVTASLVQSSEFAKKQFMLLQWNNMNKEWTKIVSAKKPAKGANGYYYTAVLEESGIYALVENKSVSVTPVLAMAPKNVALTYVEIISREPFIRIEGDISTNQREAKFNAPRDTENYIIRSVCKDATGAEWIEETKVSEKNILSVFKSRKKVNAYFKNK